MSQRLNKSHKEFIAHKARQLSPINDQIKVLKEQQPALVNAVRIHSLGGEAKTKELETIASDIVALLAKLPEELLSHTQGFKSSNFMRVRIPSHTHSTLYLDLPSTCLLNDDSINLEECTEPCCVELLNNILIIGKLQDKLSDLEETVLASISSITTVKKLLEEWEEAIELLPEDLKRAKLRLPALRTRSLNKAIGLPTKTRGTK